MWRAVVAAGMLMIAGCAPSKACIDLLEKAEGKYRDSLKEVKRQVPDAESDGKWKAALHDFGQVQSIADEGQRKYTVLKREDPDRSELLRKELEAVNYFQRFGTVYSCALRMQGIALGNLGNQAQAEQRKSAADAAAREAEQRYQYAIDCGYSPPGQP